ncbi:MAG: FG-GAP repeat protein [Gammaproteobacteria bacterium]|nr:FG-GAP repeat protein [Gammaproteobacteria bacterium]NNK98760.1 hypothetical protein [Xanthomonadales bacterium]
MIGLTPFSSLSDFFFVTKPHHPAGLFNHRLHMFTLAAISLLMISVPVLAQDQLGNDILGEAAYDALGSSVSLSADGKRLATGAPGSDSTGFDAGQVLLYQWSGTDWNRMGGDIGGETAYDQSGSSLSLSMDGERVAIGAPGNDGNGFDSGSVRVFEWTGTDWTQLGGDIRGEAANDESGASVALSADGLRLAVGAPKNDGNGIDSGHVRIYEWSDGSWEQLGDDIDGETFGDESGWSVALSSNGNLIAIGAMKNDGGGIEAGHARVYQWSGSEWEQLGGDIDGEAIADESGSSVSLSSRGDYLAVGAHKNDGNGIDAGHVRIYQWSGNAWNQLGSDIDGEAFGDNSGWSISLSADAKNLAIGAPNYNGNGIDSGHARLYQWSDMTWTKTGADIDGAAFGDKAGWSVALSTYANRLAVGSPLNINDNGIEAGELRVFDISTFNPFSMNPGLNDAWYNPVTSGQGFFINVFPDLGVVSLAWFTYDTELPPPDAVANLGDPGHRWLTALGPLSGRQATMQIEMTSEGLFDTATDIIRTDPPGSDGTIVLTFYGCNAATAEYDIPSINRKDTVYLQRVANDNIVLCEALSAD